MWQFCNNVLFSVKLGNHPLAFNVNGQSSYHCVNEYMPLREQISAQYLLWCMTSCRRESKSHYTCNTLYGPDHCSPEPNRGSEGRECAYPCEKNEGVLGSDYYFCYTQRDNSSWEYCGNFNFPSEKKTALEFTRYDKVCADYCKPDEDNYDWCYHVYWDYNSTLNEATLRKTWDYCRGHSPPPMETWKIILIVVAVLAIIVGIVIAGVYCSKRN